MEAVTISPVVSCGVSARPRWPGRFFRCWRRMPNACPIPAWKRFPPDAGQFRQTLLCHPDALTIANQVASDQDATVLHRRNLPLRIWLWKGGQVTVVGSLIRLPPE